MKAIIFIVLITLAGNLNAQNWRPILPDEKMNYQHSDSSYISNTIWVDSVETVADNLIYHLDRIVKDVPDNPEIVLRNQPQFLLKQVEVIGEGIYTFSYPGEFTIKTLANTGENWIFNPENNITAEVSSISIEDIFGVQDSVKYISLSDGNEIRLSKSFGILKFADFENGGNYQLMGIQDTDYGESVPDFWDIFNFEVGDIFQRYTLEEWSYYYHWRINKLQIVSKEINTNGVTYIADGIEMGDENAAHYAFLYTGELIYNFTDYPLANAFNNELIDLSDLPCCWDNGYYSRLTIYRDSNNFINKHWGVHLNQDHGDIFYQSNFSSDILTILPSIAEVFFMPHGVTYTESLGQSMEYYNDFSESEIKYFWMGFIKNGDTVGTITPDSLLLTGINNLNNVNSAVLVYPNPAYKLVTFRFTELNKTIDHINIEIHNLQGQVLMQQTGVKNEIVTLNVESLEPGIYFYTIKSRKIVVQQGKLVIQ